MHTQPPGGRRFGGPPAPHAPRRDTRSRERTLVLARPLVPPAGPARPLVPPAGLTRPGWPPPHRLTATPSGRSWWPLPPRLVAGPSGRPGWPPPPRLVAAPSGRSWWPVASAMTLVAAVGLGATLLLAPRVAAPGAGQLPAAVTSIYGFGLTYPVPSGWRRGPAPAVGGVPLVGTAAGPAYSCAGQRRSRAAVGSAFVARRDARDARPEDAARDFAPVLARGFYGPEARLTLEPPRPRAVGPATGSTARVIVGSASSRCPGLAGRVTLLAVPTARRGAAGGAGVLLLVVRYDTAGGPASPPPPAEATVEEILRGVAVRAGY